MVLHKTKKQKRNPQISQNMKRSLLIKSLMVAMLVAISVALYAPPPPPGHGHPTDQPAPLGSGLAVLATLGLAYGAAKWHSARKKKS